MLKNYYTVLNTLVTMTMTSDVENSKN